MSDTDRPLPAVVRAVAVGESAVVVRELMLTMLRSRRVRGGIGIVMICVGRPRFI